MMELKDIARVLNIDIDYIEDGGMQYLVCDGQRICTSYLSVKEIRQEFFGYVFLKEWEFKCKHDFCEKFINYIKAFWEY